MVLVAVALLLSGCASKDGGSSSSSGGAGTAATTVAPGGTVPFKVQKVDVEGHKVALSCKGTGSKTVILVGDIGQTAQQAWGMSKVPDGLANDATVCVYDRPGLGDSEEGSSPRSIANHVKELGSLITAAGIKGPVYLVGQGFGTLIVRQFTKEQRPQVAGMVLVDPPLWGLDLKTPDTPPPGVKAEYDSLVEVNRDLSLYGSGALPPGPIPTVVLGVDGSRTPLPDTMTGAAAPFSPTTTVFLLPEVEKRHEEQKQLAQKSPFGKYEIVEGAGSYVQYWNPDAVVAAVKQVLTSQQ